MATITPIQGRPGTTPPRTTTPVRTPLFVVGIALALFAFVAMFGVGLLLARGTQSVSQVKVVVASEDIQARQPITLDTVTLGQVPSNAVPPKSITSLTDISSFFALVPIYKGEVITANVVAVNLDEIVVGNSSSFLPIPTGWVAVTIPSGEEQAVAGFVAQGDYINIIATVNLSDFAPKLHGNATRTVFTNVYVIRVGPESAAPRQGQPQGVSSSLTVLMTECDAQFMTWLQYDSTLKYTLLSHHDYGTSTPAPDPACPSTTLPGPVTTAQANARWEFAPSAP